MDIILKELTHDAYSENTIENRTFILLRAVHLVILMTLAVIAHLFLTCYNEIQLSEIIPGMSDEIFANPRIFLELSDSLRKRALFCVSQILRLLHVYVFFDDSVASGEASKSTLHSYRLLITMMTRLLVQTWAMMYLMFKSCVEKPVESNKVPEWQKKCFKLISAIHLEIGIRGLCKLHGRIVVKTALRDILDFDLQGSEPDLVQCLKCNFNFDVALDFYELADHKSDSIKLNRDIAIRIFPFVLTLAERKKSSQVGLKGAMKDAMQTLVDVIGIPSERDKDVAYNTKMLDEYINSPINPLPFYNSLRGGDVPNFVSIRSDYADVAEKGFFFEYGNSLFLRYKVAKKAQSQDVDDVDDFVKYFRYNLVCGNFENWEAWYRLGQSYEFQFEDDVTYGAEKMNTKKDDLATLERRILQCYAMALGLLGLEDSGDDNDEEHVNAKCRLYMDFGMQIYSAVRPPLEREAFLVDRHERYCSGLEGVFTQQLHSEVPFENALKMAVMLFKRAISEGSVDWKNHYMIAKCYGKLKEDIQTILHHISEAVALAPIRERGEQVLEPTYKLVSTVYKYVKGGELTVSPQTSNHENLGGAPLI